MTVMGLILFYNISSHVMKHVIIFVNEAISRDYLPLFDIKTFKVSASIKV